MHERDLQRRILQTLRGMGGEWLNFHGGDVYMPRGIPDIIGCYRGRFVAIEVKLPGGEPTPIQQVWLERLKSAGAAVGVAHTVGDALDILKGWE